MSKFSAFKYSNNVIILKKHIRLKEFNYETNL